MNVVPESPVMTRERLVSLAQRIINASVVDLVNVDIGHTARMITQLAQGRVLSSDDGDTIWIDVGTMVGGPPAISFKTNQFDEELILAGLKQCEAIHLKLPGYQPDSGFKQETTVQDTAVPVRLWHESTIEAMTASRDTVIPEILGSVQRANLEAAGFIGFRAHTRARVYKEGGVFFAHQETDSEVNVIARDRAGKSIGWGGAIARDWDHLDYRSATAHAITMAQLGRNPVAVEPGRRTAIFTPEAVAPMLRFLAQQFDANETNHGRTALSNPPSKNKLHRRVLDARLTLESHPNDPEGGYRPYHDNWATPPMVWVKDGILENLAYDVGYAMDLGRAYAEDPYSLRVNVRGETATIEQMISQCKEGILVNRVANVDMLDGPSCTLTGTTTGGCFLIQDGKISKPVKNFRFLDSPFFFLNRIIAVGEPKRAAFGYTPLSPTELAWDQWDGWCRAPMIVPPLMVSDFNFSAMADFV